MNPPLRLRCRLLYNRLHSTVQFRLRTLLNGRWAEHCRPGGIHILLTELCTAKCVHCDIWRNNTREDSPTAEQWKRLLDDLRNWLGPVQIVFTGGEALMKPFTPEVVAHASKIGLMAEVLTHGYWEDQGKIERLALAKPWKVTVSVDGIGETHTLVRGRVKFWERTSRSIDTLRRLQRETGFPCVVRLKHVIMAHNLGEARKVADFANQEGMEVTYQPIEQNYNTPDNPNWFLESDNWVRETSRVIDILDELADLKRGGWHITNTPAEIEAMKQYFRDPSGNRMAVQMHMAHEAKHHCNALTGLQIQANGDIRVCTGLDPVGNFKHRPIREIWETRPRVWLSGCCMERRLTERERDKWVALSDLSNSGASKS